jgi:hypothetical protein
MSRIKKRKFPDLPERSHPDYDRLYREKNKKELSQKASAYYKNRKARNPELYKYDPIYAEKYRTNNKVALTEKQWARRGIKDFTYEKYLEELKKQDNRCKICSVILTLPQVDHCHKTGKYRGILCTPCNNSLGKYELYKEAYEKYLKETS